MFVHPAYDPDSNTWYLDTGEEASTLSALKKQLPKYTKIVDYFPKGYSYKITIKNELRTPEKSAVEKPPVARLAQQAETVKTEELVSTINSNTIKRDYPDTTPKRKCIYNHNQILNLWYSGLSAPLIAAELSMPRWSTIINIVWHARRKGDPRAVERNPRKKDIQHG